MAGLIINHDTRYIGDVIKLFNNCDVMHYNNFREDRAEEYDFIVLSGGPIDITGDNIKEEKQWLKTTKKPIFGICLGLQILCLAFSNEQLTYNKFKNRKLLEDVRFIGENYKMFYNHAYYFNALPEGFVGELKNGIVTYMKHKSKPILAFQGHPEMTEGGDKLKDFFITEIAKI